MHKKVLDKGKPDDIMPGVKNKKVKFCDMLNLFYKIREFDYRKKSLSEWGSLASIDFFPCVSQTRALFSLHFLSYWEYYFCMFQTRFKVQYQAYMGSVVAFLPNKMLVRGQMFINYSFIGKVT